MTRLSSAPPRPAAPPDPASGVAASGQGQLPPEPGAAEPAVPPADAVPGMVNAMLRRPALPLNALLVLAVLYTLYFARDVLVPIAIALMFDVLLSPVVLRLKRLHVPEMLGAALVVVGFLGGLGWGVHALSGEAGEWMHKAPAVLSQIEAKVRPVKAPVQEANRAAKEVEKLTNVAPGQPPATVTVRDRSLAETIVTGTTLVVMQVVVVVILLYFLLASGDTFMRRLVKALSRGSDKRRAVEIVRAVRHDISVYLGTVTLINAGLGCCTAVAMALIHMPNPVLWGCVAAVLNFIPYVGALTTTVILAVVGLLSFDNVGHGLLAPGLFQVFANIESNLVTPFLLGRNLTLNPALVFVALVIWGWMWGVPGALLAVPFLVLFKIFADHIEALQGVSIFLGRRD